MAAYGPYNASNISFTGGSNWQGGQYNNPCHACSDGLFRGHWYDGHRGDTMTIHFTGHYAVIIGRPDFENGYFTWTIDGGPPQTVNMQSGTIDDDTLNNDVLAVAYLPKGGSHTIVITVTGTSDGVDPANDNYVQITVTLIIS